ncbi:MAG: hypothetical protein HY513_01370 [Candidatus Aenigmarchaeota archaeon]|nr:hypothetical protein [Candidatus Aenigmarchaeota archaeon]
MIKTIIFDLGGVYFTEGTRRATKAISAEFNVPEKKVCQFISKSKEATDYRIGKITADEFWSRAKIFWNIKAKNSELEKAWHDCYMPIK